MRPPRMLLLVARALALAAAPARAVIRLPAMPARVAGNPADQMLEELIWDCGYWGAGMTQFEDDQPCFNKHGVRRKHVDPTVGHRNHIHIGLTRAGAARRTSFWSAVR